MPGDQSPLSTISALAGGLLVLAALCAVLLLSARSQRTVSARGTAILLNAVALAGAAHILAATGAVEAMAVAVSLAAVLAWFGVVILWRFPAAAAVAAPEAAPRLLSAALTACRDGVAIAATDDLAGVQIVYSNPAFEQLTGYSSEEAVGLSPSVLVDELDSLAAVREALRGSEPVCIEVPGRRKDGTRVWSEWQVVPVTDPGGLRTHTVAVLRDTTRRRRSEHALRESEARFRALFEQAADGIFVLDQAGRIVDANRQGCQILGADRDELTGRRLGEFGESSGSSGVPLWETSSTESAFCRKDGVTVAVEIRCAVIESAGRRFTLTMVRDVTRRRRAEQALREREELLRNIITHIPCGVFWKDRDSVYLGCNEQVARDHGLGSPEEVMGRSDYQLCCNAEEAARYRECDQAVMDSGQPVLDLEEFQTRADGTRATLLTSKVPLRDARGRVVGILGVYADITARKRLEEQLRQAQKMEAVGRLAGGIAHDFNNLLTVIRGNAELLLSSPEDTGPALIGDLILAADRATALIRQLLMFSRRQPVRVEVLDVNEVVTALSGLLRRLLGERIALTTALAGQPVTVRADRSHLEQVIMNLAVNARDAMPAGGILTVSTEAAERPTPQGPVRCARFSITDTGTGMTDEVKARIFEPFFTTKGPDKGTGLGLATVFGIVEQANGHIDVRSSPGAGSTFQVDLPWWEGAASGLLLTPTPLPAGRGCALRPVSVLLVEDQDAVRKFARLALEAAGHRVREAENGDAALDLVGTGGPFDVLVTDVTMPGIDGRELALRLRSLQPAIGVVVMSGYAPDSDHGRIEGAVFLEKPFSPADLLAALSRALRQSGRPTGRPPGGGRVGQVASK